MNKKVAFQHLGTIDYKEAWDYQENLFKGIVDLKIDNRNQEKLGKILAPTPNYLLFCEHPHVYTLGKSGDRNHLLVNNDELKEKEASYYEINRGGDITYHGPGQIVGYPIFDLDNFFTDIGKYLRFLEEAIILTLAEYNIEAGRIDGLTGVWIDYIEKKNPRKIAAIGVKTSRWVTMHGFAFNVNTLLDYFGNIVPCGITDKAVTSMQLELGKEMDMKEVEEKLKNHLENLFEAQFV